MRGTIGIRGIRGMCTVARVYGRAGVLQPRRVGLLPTHCVTAVSRRGNVGRKGKKADARTSRATLLDSLRTSISTCNVDHQLP